MGLAALALVANTGCGRNDTTADTTATTPATTTAANAPNNPDWWTTTKVQAKFFADDTVKGRNINVTTDNGVVSLTGAVDSDTEKTQAVALARSIDGVSSVEDHLTVQGTPASNDTSAVATTGRNETVDPAWITTKIQAQYFADPDIKPWNIDVTTMGNGLVTLSGTVEDNNDRTKATTIARNTEGVTSVDNRLRVRGENEGAADATATEPDAWLTAKIQSKYFMDSDVKGHDINVDTQNGVVTLNGTVDNEAQRTQAVAIARNTDGVKNVTDSLRIEMPADATAANKAMKPVHQIPNEIDNDEWITTKVRSRFFIDPNVKNMNVDVDTKNGVVTLKGEVQDQAARTAAEAIAKQIDGVKSVKNQLTVKQ